MPHRAVTLVVMLLSVAGAQGEQAPQMCSWSVPGDLQAGWAALGAAHRQACPPAVRLPRAAPALVAPAKNKHYDSSPHPCSAFRHLLEPEKDSEGFFLNGRATWWVAGLEDAGACTASSCFPGCERMHARQNCSPALPLLRRFEHPHTGSCGYGRLDGYAFGRDAVAAMPDVNPDWKAGSCGRCYELKCRGIRARRYDGVAVGGGRGGEGRSSHRAGCLLPFPTTAASPCRALPPCLQRRRLRGSGPLRCMLRPQHQDHRQDCGHLPLPGQRGERRGRVGHTAHTRSLPPPHQPPMRTCPPQKWCCGDAGLVHFDLSDGAFKRLAPQVRAAGGGNAVHEPGHALSCLSCVWNTATLQQRQRAKFGCSCPASLLPPGAGQGHHWAGVAPRALRGRCRQRHRQPRGLAPAGAGRGCALGTERMLSLLHACNCTVPSMTLRPSQGFPLPLPAAQPPTPALRSLSVASWAWAGRRL